MCFRIAIAQNFIPDSSFERNKYTPTDFSSLHLSDYWQTAGWGTSDLFCKCDRKQKKYSLVDIPNNPMGNQETHSGTCYAGIFVFSHGNYREYLQTPLTTTLEKGKTYLLTMYISLADYSPVSIDQLGVCFLSAKVRYESSEVITDLNPVYINIAKEIKKDMNNWHRISATYKAKGGELYLLIGSFEIHKMRRTAIKVPKEIRSQINQRTGRDAYYYIDDVSLVETVSTEQIDTTTITIEKIPTDTLLIFKNVLFKTNEATLLPSSDPELDLLVNYLKQNLLSSIEIIGHTDSSGNEKINKKLSIQRAKAVEDYLIQKGIEKTRIEHSGYGSSKPITTNETEEGKQKNRRVEFRIIKK